MKNIFYLNIVIYSLLLCNISFAAFETPKNPKSAKGCAICHFRWIDTFFAEGKGSDLIPYQSEKVVATPGICLSCHDGSVMDSRKKVNNNFGHKTNISPPVGMKIPEIFPLDEKGRMQCATCHTAHGVPSGEDKKTTIFMRTSNINSAMCRVCHPKMDGGIKAGHHPFGVVQREIPATIISIGAVVGEKKNQVICETCHTAHGSPYAGFLLGSSGNYGICLDCHKDKNIFTSDGKKRPTHVINIVPRKAKIPKTLIQKGAKLGKTGVITCLTCHKVHHNTVEQQLLLIKKDKKSTLCLTCHGDKKDLAATKHNLMNSAPQEKNLEGETVEQGGVCSACHLPHKAARKLSGEKDFTSRLCLSCHGFGQGKIAGKVNISGKTHPLIVDPFKKEDTGSVLRIIDVKRNELKLPLFNTVGVQDTYGKMTCATCHNIHGSQADSIKGKAGEKKTFFLRKQTPNLCGECHGNKLSITNSKHDLKTSAPFAKNVLKQTPSESGLCGTCHLVHGSHKNYLWAREITTDDEKENKGMCVSCHHEKGIAGKKIHHGYSHPMDISPHEKGLRTNLPLFDQHGKWSGDGVIRCYTCHNPHRWNPLKKTTTPEHIHLEGNSINSFLRIENSPSPKLCENCHTDKAYVEKTDHDLGVTAPSSINVIGQTPVQSGVCGVCHLVHNSKNKIKLWARNFTGNSDIMAKMCDSCHSAKGPAKNKIPEVSTHPKEKIIVLKKDLKGNPYHFPLFDETSGEPVNAGNISCPSCHNVHQWSPRFPAKGSGVNVEGNATNSFLRARASSLPCKDCHGIDGLFRFKYFHESSERKKVR